MKYRLGEHQVKCAGEHFIAPGAAVIGDVTIEEDVSIWFNAVIRADNANIRIGAGSNIQECAVLHVDPGMPMRIGASVTVGHKAMLHGCTIEDTCLIGMNAVVLNGARIGSGSLIGANTLVTENTVIPPGSLAVGSPARVIRQLDETQIAQIAASALGYRQKIALYKQELQPQAD